MRGLYLWCLLAATLTLSVSCREPAPDEFGILGLNDNGVEVIVAPEGREHEATRHWLEEARTQAKEHFESRSELQRVVVGVSAELRAGVPLLLEAEASSGLRFHFERGQP